MTTPSTDRERTPPHRRTRSVPAVYGAVSLVLVAGALTFALSSPPPSTPPLAEVAPAPQENIEVERVEQSSRFGEGGAGEGHAECAPGDAGCAGAGDQNAAEPTPPPRDVEESGATGDVRRCHHGGRTQTEDPQSPPCVVEIFRGDNGGSTARGVTGTSIRVAVPYTPPSGSRIDHRTLLDAVEAHIYQYYELYGRRLELVYVEAPKGWIDDPAQARAVATKVNEVEPFAALGLRNHPTTAYRDALTADGVLVVSGDHGWALHGRGSASDHGPYHWSVYPSLAERLRAVGDLACSSLVGRPAQHGGEQVRDVTRRFGLFVEVAGGLRHDPSALVERLRACDAPFAVFDDVDNTGQPDSGPLEPVFRRMQEDGVTTVVCVCARLHGAYTHAAENAGFRPEWLLPSPDGAGDGRTVQQEVAHPDAQLQHQFGLTAGLRWPGRTAGYQAERAEEQFWYRAVREQDPSIQMGLEDLVDEYYARYAQLLVLAAGVQAAGPRLAPDTFAAALERLVFANPGVGAAPWFQPGVGFGPGDHTFNSDHAVFWFELPDLPVERDERARRRSKGEMCYVGAGARFRTGSFPADLDDRLFNLEAGCR